MSLPSSTLDRLERSADDTAFVRDVQRILSSANSRLPQTPSDILAALRFYAAEKNLAFEDQPRWGGVEAEALINGAAIVFKSQHAQQRALEKHAQALAEQHEITSIFIKSDGKHYLSTKINGKPAHVVHKRRPF